MWPKNAALQPMGILLWMHSGRPGYLCLYISCCKNKTKTLKQVADTVFMHLFLCVCVCGVCIYHTNILHCIIDPVQFFYAHIQLTQEMGQRRRAKARGFVGNAALYPKTPESSLRDLTVMRYVYTLAGACMRVEALDKPKSLKQ